MPHPSGWGHNGKATSPVESLMPTIRAYSANRRIVGTSIGLANAGGDLQANFQFPVGKLPPGLEARTHVLQAAMIDLPEL